MPTEHESHVPFNEQAALEELERLQRALEESRQKRKDASAAFDQFVNSFRKEPGREPRPEHAAWPRAEVGPSTLVRDSRIAPPILPATRRNPLPRAGIFAGAVVVIAAGVAVTRMWRASPPQSPASSSVSSAVPGAPATTTPARLPTSESAVPAGTQSELRALRHVWVRATVDGKRVLERELNAGDRVPVNGRTIVIRAGDAGAVRVVIDGRDRGILGETGIAVTRTYTSSAAR
jgi:uncharacterized protein DUF4115